MTPAASVPMWSFHPVGGRRRDRAHSPGGYRVPPIGTSCCRIFNDIGTPMHLGPIPLARPPPLPPPVAGQHINAHPILHQGTATFPTNKMVPTATLVLSALGALVGRVSAAPASFSEPSRREVSFVPFSIFSFLPLGFPGFQTRRHRMGRLFKFRCQHHRRRS